MTKIACNYQYTWTEGEYDIYTAMYCWYYYDTYILIMSKFYCMLLAKVIVAVLETLGEK